MSHTAPRRPPIAGALLFLTVILGELCGLHAHSTLFRPPIDAWINHLQGQG
jgi:hypothetical protein